MSDVSVSIREWLHEQQDWLQEAAERLLEARSLDSSGIESLVALLKTSEGQAVTNHRRFEGLGATSPLADELRLVEIGEITGIENLVPRTPLRFGPGNLTVIYGHNGSGKSSYTRILKRACGKPRAEPLRPNVFKDTPQTRQCRIDFRVGTAARSTEWCADGPPINEIRAVDVFDADAASFYISQETAASYVPAAVSLFERLAALCDQVRARLQQQQQRLVSGLPALPPEYSATAAGQAYSTLSANISDGEIDDLTNWGQEEQDCLDRLTERLKTSDPRMLARRRRSRKLQLEQFAAQVKAAAAGVSIDRIRVIRNARNEAQRKRKIAAEAAQVGRAQLEGIGTDTWNALWEAARAYSQVAYPGADYPVTAGGARCLLCHQVLAEEAQERLRDFEEFVQGAVEAEARAAEDAFKAALESLPTIPAEDVIRTRCEASGLTEHDWPDRLVAFWRKVGKTCELLVSGETQEKAAAVDSPGDIIDEMARRSTDLEQEASQRDEDARSFDRAKALSEKTDLEARRWIAQQAAAIRFEVVRLKELESYDAWMRLASSQPISMKAGDIAERVITRRYVDRFNRELKALGASRVRVELTKTRTRKGEVLHKLRLKGTHHNQALPESVLSDGERRVVALAAFLADVAEKPRFAPFVFDDPISSLDHDFEWNVAVRLARLAQNRQVIVFTHRLSLYGALRDAAEKIGEKWIKDHLEQQCIETFQDVAGHPVDGDVWGASTARANETLLNRLDEAKEVGESAGPSAYRIHAQSICTDFRKLLERTVEDDLLNRVVMRHRRSVTTEKRLAPLSSITREDCQLIDALMTKYSCYEHSQSQETPVFLPHEPELRADLESLKNWRVDFKLRAKEGRA